MSSFFICITALKARCDFSDGYLQLVSPHRAAPGALAAGGA
jgi:hypothetical protein